MAQQGTPSLHIASYPAGATVCDALASSWLDASAEFAMRVLCEAAEWDVIDERDEEHMP